MVSFNDENATCAVVAAKYGGPYSYIKVAIYFSQPTTIAVYGMGNIDLYPTNLPFVPSPGVWAVDTNNKFAYVFHDQSPMCSIHRQNLVNGSYDSVGYSGMP